MKRKIRRTLIAFIVLGAALEFSTFSFAASISPAKDLADPKAPFDRNTYPDSSSVEKSGQLLAYSKNPKATITFTDINAGLTGVDFSSAAWGDYDNDGDLDILMTGSPDGSLGISRIYRNNGNGTFTDINAGLLGMWGGSVAWGDYDNDGWLDVLLTGSNNVGFYSKIYHNNGNGTFTDINVGLFGAWWSSAAWGDYDNDGWLDIALIGYDVIHRLPISKIYHNNGDGIFMENINAGVIGVSGRVAWGDYDNDGWSDILLTGQTSLNMSISKIYHNNGNGTFTDINAGLANIRYGDIAWADYNNDGYLDLVVAGAPSIASPYFSKIYHNNGNGTFTENTNAGLIGVVGSVAWGDYDNDGWLDIALIGYDAMHRLPIFKIYHNNGNGSFVDMNVGLMGTCRGNVAWGDYDNDGRLDILMVGSIVNSTSTLSFARIYHNQGGLSNTISDVSMAFTSRSVGSIK